MNPAEDALLSGDQLTEGMWVLAELSGLRLPRGTSEDDLLRRQRFRRVSDLRCGAFTGTWIDGYQETHAAPADRRWIVKKAPVNPEAAAGARDVAGMCRSGYARHAESAAALGLSPAPEPGPVFGVPDGGAFTVTRGGRSYTVTVTPAGLPAEGEGK